MKHALNHSKKQLPRLLRNIIGLFLFCAGLTLLFLGMRAVMMVGGFCAEGGAYEIAVPCPKGIPTLMPIAILSIIIGGGLYFSSHLENGPRWGFLFWSAIFISLGWNFMEFAIYPPQVGDVVISWVVCGVLFIVLGVVPLLLMFNINTSGIFFGSTQPQSQFSGKISFIPRGLIFLMHVFATAIGIYSGLYLYNQFS